MNIETANRLYELRKKMGLSQEELAERLGVSRQAVSKWERSEASPDTDNLIALAKIYGLTLDELIYGKIEEKQEESSGDTAAPKTDGGDGKERVRIDTNGIYVDNGGGTKVKVGLDGIFVKTADDDEYRETDGNFKYDAEKGVHLDADGGRVVIDVKKPKITKRSIWLDVPYAVICVIAYLLCGFCDVFGGWALSWIIFVTIPLYYTLIDAFVCKRVSMFCYPVLCAVIYLYLGMYHGNWHPSWLIFVTIPVFYPIAEAIDRRLGSKGIGSDGDEDD